LGKGFRDEDAAADRPKQAGTGPCHALEKAATINSIVFVIVRNVIGHNIVFWFGFVLLNGLFTCPYRFGATLFPKSLARIVVSFIVCLLQKRGA
jgi:hypothetical protein